MKNRSIYCIVIVLIAGALPMACQENEVLPDHQTVGTSTATLVELGLSNETPQPGEEVTMTISYVNLDEDPASQIEVLTQVDEGDFTTFIQLDESSAATNSEITRTVTYTVPALDSGTVVTLDMLLSTQREFPQRERISLTVQ